MMGKVNQLRLHKLMKSVITVVGAEIQFQTKASSRILMGALRDLLGGQAGSQHESKLLELQNR